MVTCNICGKKIADSMDEPWHLHMLEHSPQEMAMMAGITQAKRKGGSDVQCALSGIVFAFIANEIQKEMNKSFKSKRKAK